MLFKRNPTANGKSGFKVGQYAGLIFCVLAALSIFNLDINAQMPAGYFPFETAGNNIISFGTDKYFNTYTFMLNGEISHDTPLGVFTLKPYYSGSTIRSQTNSFRDEVSYSLDYSKPIGKNLFAASRNNLLISSDTRSLTINEHRRFNFLTGLRYLDENGSFFELLGGAESNKQITLESPGALAVVNGKLNPTDIEGYKLSSVIKSEFLRLNNSRLNSDVDLKLNVEKSYDKADNLRLSGRYSTMGRNFLSSIGGADPGNPQIETRLENRIGADAAMDFGISGNLIGRTSLSIDKLSVERYYKSYFSAAPQTGAIRNLNELQLGISTELFYSAATLQHIFGFSLNYRGEENLISKRYDLSDTELKKMRSIENQRDNVTTRNRFYSKTNWFPSKKDTFRLNGQISLMRYDTPSPENNDDRDELYIAAAGEYSRKFSPELSANFIFDLQINHYVYLKSARSALNYLNRTIRFSPGVSLSTSTIKMNPQFEVLANYTVYDFEDKGVSPKSYSFRQITFKDSLIVFFGKNISLQTKYLFRYFERGILYWKSFSENPQNSNFETFIKSLAVAKVSDRFEVGIGGRFYRLSQKNLNRLSINNISTEIVQNSYAPETAITARFGSGSEISINGWYEFQFYQNKIIKKVPNIFLHTSLKY